MESERMIHLVDWPRVNGGGWWRGNFEFEVSYYKNSGLMNRRMNKVRPDPNPRIVMPCSVLQLPGGAW